MTVMFTLLNEVKGICIFELIFYSNEIFISSNKNHPYFLQFNEVKNGIFILFGTFQITCELIYFL